MILHDFRSDPQATLGNIFVCCSTIYLNMLKIKYFTVLFRHVIVFQEDVMPSSSTLTKRTLSITQTHLMTALKKTKPSISQDDRNNYADL